MECAAGPRDGQERLALGASSTALSFTPDGRTLATSGGSGAGMALWQASTGQELIALKSQYPVTSLAFSPDGAALAVGSGYRDENEGTVLFRAERADFRESLDRASGGCLRPGVSLREDRLRGASGSMTLPGLSIIECGGLMRDNGPREES